MNIVNGDEDKHDIVGLVVADIDDDDDGGDENYSPAC